MPECLWMHTSPGAERRDPSSCKPPRPICPTVSSLNIQALHVQVQKSGDTLKLLSSDGTSSATIVYPDVHACNAIIQVIDTVLTPAASAPVAPAAAPAAQAGMTQPAAAAGGR